MKTEKIQKINWGYLLGYILVPLLVVDLFYVLSLKFPHNDAVGICAVVSLLATIAWYMFTGNWFHKAGVKKLEKAMDAQGLIRNQTFRGGGCTVCVDLNQGMLGLAFFWNPFRYYIISASRLGTIWVDAGKKEWDHTARVSFLFYVDQVKVRVYTFISNMAFSRDSKEILTGISKADLMVAVLEEAKRKAG